jgi:serine phosphatase RsbU (regulator of sigma subunit)/tetratricopeptide (TPR) repeat protein
MNKRPPILFRKTSSLLKFIIILICCSSAVATAQQDYLQTAGQIDDPVKRILFLNRIADSLTQQDPGKSKELSLQALSIAESIKNDTLIYESRFTKGIANYFLSNQNEALEDFIKNKELAKKINDAKRIIESANAIGNTYKEIDRVDKALETYKEALRLSQNLPPSPKIDLIKGNIAIVFSLLKKYDSSNVYCYDLLRKHQEYSEESRDYPFISNVFSTLLSNYSDMLLKDSTEKYIDTVLQLKRILNDRIGEAGVLYNVGVFYNKTGDHLQAEKYLRQAFKTNEGNLQLEYNIRHSLAITLHNQKKFEEAAKLYAECIALKDSLNKVQTIDKLSELEVKYETGKKEEELKRLSLQKEMDDLRIKQSKTWLIISIGGIMFCFVVAGILYRQSKSRKKANKLLEHQNQEILLQKKEITDSINYAKKIQLSIQPPEEMVRRLLPNCFIFYKPKDVVSGDFYWLEEKNGLVMFAAVDCTGHGVPGAMMSVVGLNLLNQAVNEKGLTVPSEILQHLDKGVTDTLRQTAGADTVKDGMDLSLCALDPKTNILQYSGAFNNLWLVRKNISSSYIASGPNEVFFENDLLEIKADKFPIGSNLDGIADNYTNHTLQLQKDDCVYLYSDGFADQFGGPKGKKFKYNALKKLLISAHHLQPSEQREKLAQAFNDWKGNLEQVDDILVIGVKIS